MSDKEGSITKTADQAHLQRPQQYLAVPGEQGTIQTGRAALAKHRRGVAADATASNRQRGARQSCSWDITPRRDVTHPTRHRRRGKQRQNSWRQSGHPRINARTQESEEKAVAPVNRTENQQIASTSHTNTRRRIGPAWCQPGGLRGNGEAGKGHRHRCVDPTVMNGKPTCVC